jgi:hypothetical protein
MIIIWRVAMSVITLECSGVDPVTSAQELQGVIEVLAMLIDKGAPHVRWISTMHAPDMKEMIERCSSLGQQVRSVMERLRDMRRQGGQAGWYWRLSQGERDILAKVMDDHWDGDLESCLAALEQSPPIIRLAEEYGMYARMLETGKGYVPRHFVSLRDQGERTQLLKEQIRVLGRGMRMNIEEVRHEVWPLVRHTYRVHWGFRDEENYLQPVSDPMAPFIQCAIVIPPFRGFWHAGVLLDCIRSPEVRDIRPWVVIDIEVLPSLQTSYLLAQTEANIRVARQGGGRTFQDRFVWQEQEEAIAEAQQSFGRGNHAGVDVCCIIGWSAPSLERLREGYRQLRARLEPYSQGVRCVPVQDALVKLFTPGTEVPEWIRKYRHRMMSDMAAYMIPVSIRRWPLNEGIIWMESVRGPVMFNPFRRNAAGHMVIIGRTGSGKTVALHAVALRMATMLQARIIVYEPQGHCRRLADAGHGSLRTFYHRVSAHESYNILDVLIGGEEDRPPVIGEQVTIVMALLGIVLGTTMGGTATQGGGDIAVRSWSAEEQTVLEQALYRVYRPWADRLDDLEPEESPLLEDVVRVLEMIADEEGDEHLSKVARGLAREIRMRIVDGPAATMFNRRTSVRWRFDGDIIAYDLSELPEGAIRRLVQVLGLGAVNREMRRRRNRRPTVVVVDEFGAMTMGSQGIADYVAAIAKTGRTWSLAVAVADQEAQTFLGEQASVAVRATWTNAPIRLIFQQDRHNAALVVRSLRHAMQEEEERTITELPVGCAYLVWDRDGTTEVALGRVVLTSVEQRYFLGT